MNQEINNKVVYVHKRADTGEPFYVGMGNPERPWAKFKERAKYNPFWGAVKNKHGIIVEILYSGLSKEEAREIEIRLIAEYRQQYKMTNITDGGEGGTGLSGKENPNYGNYGEENHSFKGHVILLSTCGKFYYITSGYNDLLDAGFHDGHVYGILTGSLERNYITATKIYVDGIKIRFIPYRFKDVNDIPDEMLIGREEARPSDIEISGRSGSVSFGSTHHNSKGYVIGVDGKMFVILDGITDQDDKGFYHSNVSQSIKNNPIRPRVRGYKFIRFSEHPKEFQQQYLNDLKLLQPYDQDSQDRLQLLLEQLNN